MSKERGQQAREKFQGWIAEMKAKTSPNWLDYWHGGKLSPKKIASELGFDSSCSGLIKPDTNLSGKITTLREVFNVQTTSYVFNRF